MRRARGFALIDSLLAFLALSLMLSPLLVLHRQSIDAVSQSALRSRLVLLASGYAEALRHAESTSLPEPTKLKMSSGQKRAVEVSVKVELGPYWSKETSDRLRTIQISWRDPIYHQISMAAP